MKQLLFTIAMLLLFVACEEDGPTGNKNDKTDNGLVGCWEVFDYKSFSDTGTITFHPNNIGSDTIVFNDSIWWQHTSGYVQNIFTEEWYWVYNGLSDFGEYSYNADTIYFQHQSDLANPEPENYSLTADTLILFPEQFIVPNGSTWYYRRINCNLALPGKYRN